MDEIWLPESMPGVSATPTAGMDEPAAEVRRFFRPRLHLDGCDRRHAGVEDVRLFRCNPDMYLQGPR